MTSDNLYRPKSITYLSPNLRNDELFKTSADIYDHLTNKSYWPIIQESINIFNPSSFYYNPDYIIRILGGTEIANLLSEYVDKTTISMILPGLLRVKGQEISIQTILKLLDIGFKRLLKLKQFNGQTYLVIVIEDGIRLPESKVRLLKELADSLLYICVSIVGIINESVYKEYHKLGVDDYTVNPNYHSLDFGLRWDFSFLSGCAGTIVSGTNIAVLLYNIIREDVGLFIQLIHLDGAHTRIHLDEMDWSGHYRRFHYSNNWYYTDSYLYPDGISYWPSDLRIDASLIRERSPEEADLSNQIFERLVLDGVVNAVHYDFTEYEAYASYIRSYEESTEENKGIYSSMYYNPKVYKTKVIFGDKG